MFATLISQCIQEDAVEIECDVFIYTYVCHTVHTECIHVCIFCCYAFFDTHSWALFCPDFFGSRIFVAELRICSKLSLNKAQKTQREKKHELARIFPCIFFGSMVILNKALLLEVFFCIKKSRRKICVRSRVCLSELWVHTPLFVVKKISTVSFS